MAGVSVKMGVDVSQFKQGMQQAQQSVKTLDAQLKLNEKQLKANGDAELYMSNKAKLLDKQMEEQQKVVSGLYKQLDEMKERGVEETSEAYQKLERSIYNAAGKMMDIQAEINSLTEKEQQSAAGASLMEQNLSSINKKVSFDAVIKGVDSITGALEGVAKKAISVGESLFDEIKKAAKWADDSATMADIYEIPLDRYLRMQKLVDNGLDTSVDSMISAMDKMNTAVSKGSTATYEALDSLGLLTKWTNIYGEEIVSLEETNPEELFWKVGQALKNMPAGFDKNATAMALYGKSWREMLPLFKQYNSLEEYEAALAGVTVNSEDAVTQLAELNNRLNELESAWNSAKFEALKALAPSLQDAAKAIADLLNRITEYLKTDAGQEQLQKLSDAVSNLFDDLGKIDPEQVVQNFSTVFGQIVDSFTWIADHWNEVKIGLLAIAGGFGAIKIATLGLSIAQIISGLKTAAKSSDTTTTQTQPSTPGQTTQPTSGTNVEYLDTKFGQAAATSFVIGEYMKVYEQGQKNKRELLSLLDTYKPDLSTKEAKQKYIDVAFAVDGVSGGDAEQAMQELVDQFGSLSEEAYKQQQADLGLQTETEKLSNAFDGLSKVLQTIGGGGGGGTPMYTFGADGGGLFSRMGFHANGLFSVPWDGYPAILHKGERVLTAREAKTYNANSHLYVDNMYMNGNLDAEYLSDMIAKRTQRIQRGFGS